jgi:hypothetical protein
MTREHNFRTSLRTQLNAYSGWSIVEPQTIKRLATQSFTAFSVELGRMHTIQSDFWGRMLQGMQEFTLRIYIRFDQLKPDAASQMRSDALSSLQLFFSTFYSPPILQIGETERIEKATIESIDKADIDPNATRHEIVVRGRYYFTQF